MGEPPVNSRPTGFATGAGFASLRQLQRGHKPNCLASSGPERTVA
jgi:hypothetical protein